MNEKNLNFKNNLGFELYLEGKKVGFSSITISEVERAFPTATITFPATSKLFYILPATLVQVFGPSPEEGSVSPILLFEGEVSSISYVKAESGTRQVSFSCTSLLAQWERQSSRPPDTFMTSEYKRALTGSPQAYTQTQGTTMTYGAQAATLLNLSRAESGDTVSNLLVQIDPTALGGFADEVIQLLNNDAVSSGDLHVFMQFFVRFFETNDIYYGALSQAFNIPESILTWPNSNTVNNFALKAILENFFSLTGSMKMLSDGALGMMAAISQALNTFGYTANFPSNVLTNQFWTQGGSNGLLRGILTPELENSPPMLCNIFHSSEISHFNYSRQFLPEPTRSIGSVTSPLFQGNAISSFLETTLFTTYPKLTTNTELADKGIIPMTEEESWRGITAHTPKLDQNMTHVLTEESVKAAEEKIAAKEGEEYATTGLQEKMGAPLKQFTSLEHSKMRLRNRSFSFSADWNPYRLIGFPGAYIETVDDGPMITGVVSSIQTVISSSGSAIQNISFRACRALPPGINALSSEGEEDLLELITLDPYLNINAAFMNEKDFASTEIGKKLYRFLSEGELSPYKEPWNSKVFADFRSNLDKVEKDTTVDYSVVRFFNETQEKPKWLVSDLQAAYSIYSSLDNLRIILLNKEKDELYPFLKSLQKRKLVTKADYQRYVNFSYTSNSLSHYRDGKIFSDPSIYEDLGLAVRRRRVGQGSSSEDTFAEIQILDILIEALTYNVRILSDKKYAAAAAGAPALYVTLEDVIQVQPLNDAVYNIASYKTKEELDFILKIVNRPTILFATYLDFAASLTLRDKLISSVLTLSKVYLERFKEERKTRGARVSASNQRVTSAFGTDEKATNALENIKRLLKTPFNKTRLAHVKVAFKGAIIEDSPEDNNLNIDGKLTILK